MIVRCRKLRQARQQIAADGWRKSEFPVWSILGYFASFRRSMTWEIAVVLALVLFALVQFMRERWPLDLTGLVVFAALLLLSQLPGNNTFPTTERLLMVFANAAPLTVASMFILTYALERTGAITRAMVALERCHQ